MNEKIALNIFSVLILIGLYLCIVYLISNYASSRIGLGRVVLKNKNDVLIFPLHNRRLGYTTKEASEYFRSLDSFANHCTAVSVLDRVFGMSNLKKYSTLVNVMVVLSAIYTLGLLKLIAVTQVASISFLFASLVTGLALTYFVFDVIESRFLVSVIEMVDADTGRFLLADIPSSLSSLKGQHEKIDVVQRYHRSIILSSFATVVKCWSFIFTLLLILIGSLHPAIDYIWIHY